MHLQTVLFQATSLFLLCPTIARAVTLTLGVPSHIPALPASSTAYLTAYNQTFRALVTRSNTFIFSDLTTSSAAEGKTKAATSYLLDIACRDYEFATYGVDVKGNDEVAVEVYRVGRGGADLGLERVRITDENPAVVELKILKTRDYYETRTGFNPAGLLKNPMILIGAVGLVFIIGVPYLLDNMDPETRREFEEQQKKGVFGTGASSSAAANPLQNFDMAAWMAGRPQQQARSASPATGSGRSGGTASGGQEGAASRARRRG